MSEDRIKELIWLSKVPPGKLFEDLEIEAHWGLHLQPGGDTAREG